MAFSEADICNMALSILGVAGITSLDQRSPEAAACKLHYPLERDMMLSEYSWGFATEQHTLNKMDEEPLFGWTYVYQIPNDALVIQAVGVTDRNAPESLPFKMGRGGRIYTDVDDALAYCTMQLNNAGDLPAYFVDAFSARLAVKLAGTLQNLANRREHAADLYNAAAQQAMLSDSIQGSPRKQKSFALNARMGISYNDAGTLIDGDY